MRIMSKLLIFTLLCSLVIIGLMVVGLENSIEEEIEKAIYVGYPGTGNVDVELNINWFKGGLKGNITSFNINIEDWKHKNWRINTFQGNFSNVRINWLELYRKKQLVIERIEQGKIQVTIDEKNLNDALNRYYQALTVKLDENRLNINFNMKILGYSLIAKAQGHLISGQGAEIYFVPDKVDIGKYKVPESIRQELLQKLKIPLSLEKTPFTFQVTTVKIMHDKIIIDGKV